MSQSIALQIVVQGMVGLIDALVQSSLTHKECKEFRTEDGKTHSVDLVVTDEKGTQVGVKVDAKTGIATFIAHDEEDKRATALINRVAQRYAYSQTLNELKRKGYQITREESQQDGTIKLVAQRWR